MFVYLDNSSTTKPYAEVVEKMKLAMEHDFGNPSSLHRLGIEAENLVKKSRENIAHSLGAKSDEIIFTSGGTESDNSIIYGLAKTKIKKIYKKIITTKVEHPAVLETCKKLENEGFKLEYLDVDKKCNINMEQLKSYMDDETFLISVMTVNNEVGTIMPIDDIVALKKGFANKYGRDLMVHTDAVQAYGKLNLNGLKVDAMSISGHKIHGPKGIGASYVKTGINLRPLIVGGGQEKNMRSGTENVPAIAGFGKAAWKSCENLKLRIANMKSAREYLLNGIKSEIKDIIINSPEDVSDEGSIEAGKSVASVLNVSFLGTRSEVILHTLEQDDIFISTGSACASNKGGGSHVLKAMGLNQKAIEGAIRFSFSEFNTIEEMDYVLDKLKIAVDKFRKLGTFR